MTWSLPEPMLTVAVDGPALPAGWAAEPKWDGYRAQLAVYAGGRALLRSRRGTDMAPAFPEIRAAALAQLPEDTGLDGELVVWERDRLAFERLQQRLARRGAAAAQAAREWPAHFVAFDLVHRGDDLTGWPYARRRAALEALFAERGLAAPFTLCPSTTDPALAREWLSWTAAGVEGLCFKRLEESYHGGVRSWRQYKVRVTTEAVFPVKFLCSVRRARALLRPQAHSPARRLTPRMHRSSQRYYRTDQPPPLRSAPPARPRRRSHPPLELRRRGGPCQPDQNGG
ncbi:hypothetical protein ACFYSF_35925 [Streptomyces canus]|uniref:ATP-dependent DNA ligase n=1 Tax=Streptomyces canus TaxID=58343 RepID=UPI0036BE9172